MKGSTRVCPACSSESLSRGASTISCAQCQQVLEERYIDLRTTQVTSQHDSPLCLVTTDLSDLFQFDEGEIPDDPFFSKGFITAFSQMRVHNDSAFVSTSRTVPGELADLERLLGLFFSEDDAFGSLGAPAIKQEQSMRPFGQLHSKQPARHNEMKSTEFDLCSILHGYVQIQDIRDEVGLDSNVAEEAFKQFCAFAKHKSLANKNIPALAAACIVCTVPNRMQEIQLASGIAQREIAQHIRTLTLWSQSVPSTSSSSLASLVQRTCDLLQMDRDTQNLALHIAEQVFTKKLCGSHRAMVTSVAVVHIAHQMQNPSRSLEETGSLANVSAGALLGAYKDLIAHIDAILPGSPQSGDLSARSDCETTVPDLPFLLQLPKEFQSEKTPVNVQTHGGKSVSFPGVPLHVILDQLLCV